MSVGENIKALRKNKGLSQKQLADEVELSEITIRRYEKGINDPTTEVVNKIAEALGVPVNMILLGKDVTSIIEEAANKSANHIVDDIYPLVEYVNQNRFDGKYNVKEVFSSSELIDLGGLIDDIVSNRLIHVVNKNK